MHPTLNERQTALADFWPRATTPYLHALARQEARAIAAERDALAKSCFRLVCHVVNKVFARWHFWREELVAAGNYGLARAVGSFRPGCSRFSTYAYPAILHAVQQEREFLASPIHVPAKHRRSERFDGFAAQAYRIVPLPYRIEMRQSAGQIEDRSEHWLSFLPLRDRHVVKRRVLDDAPYNVIGDELGVTRQRAEQIYRQGLALLREKLKELVA